MIDFSRTTFDYIPYPIGLAKPAVNPDFYRRMVAAFPPTETFAVFTKGGSNKYHLSEKANPQAYHDFIRNHPVWRPFYDYIKSDAFIHDTLNCLDREGIKLALGEDKIASNHHFQPRQASGSGLLTRTLRAVLNRPPLVGHQLSARFEFSSLPSDGGNIQPHTDHHDKVITLVVSILDEGEWNPQWGGGTEVLESRDPRCSFNHINAYQPLEECRTVKVFDYTPNQCVIFVKTFNSLHAVRPMSNHGGSEQRRTLTINIERSPMAAY